MQDEITVWRAPSLSPSPLAPRPSPPSDLHLHTPPPSWHHHSASVSVSAPRPASNTALATPGCLVLSHTHTEMHNLSASYITQALRLSIYIFTSFLYLIDRCLSLHLHSLLSLYLSLSLTLLLSAVSLPLSSMRPGVNLSEWAFLGQLPGAAAVDPSRAGPRTAWSIPSPSQTTLSPASRTTPPNPPHNLRANTHDSICHHLIYTNTHTHKHTSVPSA